jgi:hypothetical protein
MTTARTRTPQTMVPKARAVRAMNHAPQAQTVVVSLSYQCCVSALPVEGVAGLCSQAQPLHGKTTAIAQGGPPIRGLW